MSIRPRDVLLYGGAECLEKFGTLLWRRSRAEDKRQESFSRSGSARLVGPDGVLRTATTDRVRLSYVTDNTGASRRIVLLERASQNEFTQSEDLTHADWTEQNLSTRTANQATGPDNATSLDELVENSSTAVHGVRRDVTLTADATYALSCWAIANTRSVLLLRMYEAAAGSNLARAWFDLSAGTVGTTAAIGTASFKRAIIEDFTDVAAGLYRCTLVASIGNGATSIRCEIDLADADGSASYAGDGSSSLYAGFAQLEDTESVGSSYIPTTTAAVARVAEDLTLPLPAIPPVEMTVHARFVELGTAYSADFDRLFSFGGDAGNASVEVFAAGSGTRQYRGRIDDGGGNSGAQTAAVAASLFDLVDIRLTVDESGSCVLYTSVNGGAETASSAFSVPALPGEWNVNAVSLNSNHSGSLPGLSGWVSFKAVRGNRTLAEMQELFA